MRHLVFAIVLSILCAVRAQELTTGTDVAGSTGDRVTFGKIRVDKKTRTVCFPATVNMTEGLLEYLLVTDQGKTHESLFVTTVSPFQMHVAMLLLGVNPTREISEPPPEQITAGSLKNAPGLKGDNVDILISWKEGADQRQIRAEEMIHNRISQAPMTIGPWIYNGSALYQKRFLAQTDGSIVALVTDPAALINNPRPGHDDDTLWSVQKEKVPAVGTPVEITIQLLPAKSTPAAQSIQ